MMLYLAQVKKNTSSGETQLELLAEKKADNIWYLKDSKYLSSTQEIAWSEGVLVLVECDNNYQTIKIQEAKDWVLSLVENFLSSNAISPEFVEREKLKIEEWRREIAAESQDLTRRYLEIETRREQLQELEEKLQREQQKLGDSF